MSVGMEHLLLNSIGLSLVALLLAGLRSRWRHEPVLCYRLGVVLLCAMLLLPVLQWSIQGRAYDPEHPVRDVLSDLGWPHPHEDDASDEPEAEANKPSASTQTEQSRVTATSSETSIVGSPNIDSPKNGFLEPSQTTSTGLPTTPRRAPRVIPRATSVRHNTLQTSPHDSASSRSNSAGPSSPLASSLPKQDPDLGSLSSLQPANVQTTEEAPAPSASPGSPSWTLRDIAPWVLALYLCGVIWFTITHTLGLRRTRQFLKSCHPLTDERVRALWDEVCEHRRPPIDVFSSSRLTSPGCWGLVRPKLVLPDNVRVDSSLEWALRHERIHIDRGDARVILLQRLLTTLFWFHPAAWWFSRWLDHLRELSCDLLVVAPTGARKRYALALLSFANARPSRSPSDPALLHWFRSPSQLRRRIEMLAMNRIERSPTTRLKRLAAIAAIFGGLWVGQLAIAATLFPQDDPSQSPQKGLRLVENVDDQPGPSTRDVETLTASTALFPLLAGMDGAPREGGEPGLFFRDGARKISITDQGDSEVEVGSDRLEIRIRQHAVTSFWNGMRLPSERIRVQGDLIEFLDEKGVVLLEIRLDRPEPEDVSGLMQPRGADFEPQATSPEEHHVHTHLHFHGVTKQGASPQDPAPTAPLNVECLCSSGSRGFCQAKRVPSCSCHHTHQHLRTQHACGRPALHLAVEQGDEELVHLILRRGAPVNELDERGLSALQLGVELGHRNIVDILLHHGADPNVVDAQGYTPLMTSLSRERWCMAENLVLHGACINTSTPHGRTPLETVLHHDREDLAVLFIRYGADVNHQDNLGRTPLHLCLENGENSLCEMLIRYGADVNVPARDGASLLERALHRKNCRLANLLIRYGADVNVPAEAHGSLLHWALDHDNDSMCELLVRHGADVNYADPSGRSPLSKVIDKSDDRLFQLILRYGADVNGPSPSGMSPLHHALLRDDDELAHALVRYGADLEALDEQGRTPLLVAIEQKDSNMASWLVANGANLNAFSRTDARSPLHKVLDDENWKLAQTFLERGANASDLDPNGMSALEKVLAKRHWNLADLFIKFGADVNQPRADKGSFLHEAIAAKNTRLISMLVHAGADVNAPDGAGRSPLHTALDIEKDSVIELLLNYGTDPNALDPSGCSPLHRALDRRDEDVVELLVQSGGDPNSVSPTGMTPLARAVDMGDEDLVSLLIHYGADVNHLDNHGESPLHRAVIHKKTGVIDELLRAGANRGAENASGRTALQLAIEMNLLNLAKTLER